MISLTVGAEFGSIDLTLGSGWHFASLLEADLTPSAGIGGLFL